MTGKASATPPRGGAPRRRRQRRQPVPLLRLYCQIGLALVAHYLLPVGTTSHAAAFSPAAAFLPTTFVAPPPPLLRRWSGPPVLSSIAGGGTTTDGPSSGLLASERHRRQRQRRPPSFAGTSAAALRAAAAASPSDDDSTTSDPKGYNNNDRGEVGRGPNWIEKSFPVETDGKTNNIKKVDDYNLGISGNDFQTGPLSRRMFDAIVSKTKLEMSDEIRGAFTLYAMDFTAKEAARAALRQNGLEMALLEEEEDQGMWGDVEAIRLYDSKTGEPFKRMYDSMEEAVKDWTPGQAFDFVARQVPAKVRELSMEELVQALDPNGALRKEAKELRGSAASPDEEALLSIFDDTSITSLAELANDNVRRTESAPREAYVEETAFGGSTSRGYRIIKRSDLLRDSINQDGTENEKTLMHVMNALVSHGVLIVDLTDGGVSFKDETVMARMWNATDSFFYKVADNDVASKLPGMTTVLETGSRHAKVGYAEYDSGSMKFLETRRERKSGTLLPLETTQVIGDEGVSNLKAAFDLVAQVGKDVVRITVASSSIEQGAFLKSRDKDDRDQKIRASQGATLLVDELIDDAKELSAAAQIEHKEGDVSMSPQRLCRYSDEKDGAATSREVFGAHTDSSWVTVVPVAAVSGLEVFDEEAEKWYRPELRARAHWEEEQLARGKDATLLYDEDEDDDGMRLPWYARYLAIMPGEHLQLATRNEVPSAVHRVVAAKGRPPRLSSPILLRGRPGTKFLSERYLGGTLGNPLLEDADGLTMEDIHDKSQPSSYQ